MSSPSQKSLAKEVLLTGLLAGTLDITAACTHAYLRSGVTPGGVLKYVASGLFGTDAFSGGVSMMIVGLLMHYTIATSWTLLFYLLYPRVGFLRKNKIVSGVVFGAFVWVMMTLVIVPLTAVPKSPFNPTSALIGMVILIFMIGMPNAFRAPSYYGK